MRTDKRIFHVFMCHGVEDYACVWYNIRRADIVPCAYRLSEAMRSVSWRAVGDGTCQLYHAHIASSRRCDHFHGVPSETAHANCTINVKRLWYNIRRAAIVPRAYRLFEAMRSISWPCRRRRHMAVVSYACDDTTDSCRQMDMVEVYKGEGCYKGIAYRGKGRYVDAYACKRASQFPAD